MSETTKAKQRSKAGAKSKTVEFEQGEQVEHPQWGVGTVIYKQGTGDKFWGKRQGDRFPELFHRVDGGRKSGNVPGDDE